MSSMKTDSRAQVETTCGTLLYELQIIWDEVGETDADRDKMLFELEQECLEVYRRKVDQANRRRAQLRQAIADSEAELAAICSAMGERPVHIRTTDQTTGSLNEELAKTIQQLEEMRKRRVDRRNQFIEVLDQIQNLKFEIKASTGLGAREVVDEADLSQQKLEEYQRQAHSLKIEKDERVKQIKENLATLESLSSVLGLDFEIAINEVHPSLGNSEVCMDISDSTIQKLAKAVQKLKEVKIQRMQRLQDLATMLLELWNLMDTPLEEQQRFQNFTANIAASEHEITEPNTLSVNFLNYVESEVARLEALKSSKMKELVLKKRSELDDICRKVHLVTEPDNNFSDTIEAIDSGNLDAAIILEQIESQIGRVKEEALTRIEILEKVEKWLAACDEECWLEEYDRDENKYNAGRGAHLMLKRAEKARALLNKLPGMVEALASRTIAWENEKGVEFLYDGVRLLSMLEDYTMLRQEKEQERRRIREQKKLQVQLIAEQEALYGSKPSPLKPQIVKKGPRLSTGGASNRRLSMGGGTLLTPKRESIQSTKATPQSRPSKHPDRMLQNDVLSNHHQDDGLAVPSVAQRGLDIAEFAVKRPIFGAINAKEAEPEESRKPFSPVSLIASFKPNNATNIEDQAKSSQKILPPNDVYCVTPSKMIALTDEENWTPKEKQFPVPSTPSTVSIPMQTCMTPAPAPIPFTLKPVEEKIPAESEFSFEERRFGFLLSKTQTPLIHV